LPTLVKEPTASYFVEAQDSLLTNKTFKDIDENLGKLNRDLLEVNTDATQKIGILYFGRQAPGANNVIDGLLRYQAKRKDVSIIGFINGVEGLLSENYRELKAEDYQHFRNLGGIDVIGRGKDELRNKSEKIKALEVCKKLGLTGLVMVGATHTLTDGVYLSQFFIDNKCNTRVVVVPCSVDGNIHHKYIRTSIGFDSASKVYSQLIGNMLTDSASAVKYWYFVRLMGKNPSHMALECALKTSPNMVIISEEVQDRRETLSNVVSNICDNICARADAGRNYGCVLIPEGLLNSVSAFSQLIDELNQVFASASSSSEFI
jgi:diphosphate--fructose-6-phosphate 1-phosphotransferase